MLQNELPRGGRAGSHSGAQNWSPASWFLPAPLPPPTEIEVPVQESLNSQGSFTSCWRPLQGLGTPSSCPLPAACHHHGYVVAGGFSESLGQVLKAKRTGKGE